MSNYDKQEPPPERGSRVVLPYAVDALENRAALAISHYGTPLMTFNGRDAFMDSAQETVDALQYVVQGIEEMRVLSEEGAMIGEVRASLCMYLFQFDLPTMRYIEEFLTTVRSEITRSYTGAAFQSVSAESIGVYIPASHGRPAVLAGDIARLINERIRTWLNS